jgi:hypothetical protein
VFPHRTARPHSWGFGTTGGVPLPGTVPIRPSAHRKELFLLSVVSLVGRRAVGGSRSFLVVLCVGGGRLVLFEMCRRSVVGLRSGGRSVCFGQVLPFVVLVGCCRGFLKRYGSGGRLSVSVVHRSVSF